MIEKIPSYTRVALDWLHSQFDDSGNIQRILKAIADEFQELEEEFHKLRTERYLDNASGDQLDQWGILVNVPRSGRSDDVYRELIRVKILRNSSEGTPDRLIKIAEMLSNAANVYYDEGDAVAEIEVEDASFTTGIREIMHSILQAAAPAGVRVKIVESDSQTSFQFDTGPGYDEGELAGTI